MNIITKKKQINENKTINISPIITFNGTPNLKNSKLANKMF